MSGFGISSRALAALWPRLRAGSPAAIHDLRKLTRRVQAQLRVAGAPGRTRRAWKRLRRAVAPIRDLDVAGALLLAGLRELGVGRGERAAFRSAGKAARSSRFRALKVPKPPPALRRPRHWKARVRAVLARDARKLLREGDSVLDSTRPDAWHTWRKHLKRYRYTLDLLDRPPAALRRVLADLGHLQDARLLEELLGAGRWLPAHREALLRRVEHDRLAAQTSVRQAWPALRRHLEAQQGAEDD